jgi:hypothetical protein
VHVEHCRHAGIDGAQEILTEVHWAGLNLTVVYLWFHGRVPGAEGEARSRRNRGL